MADGWWKLVSETIARGRRGYGQPSNSNLIWQQRANDKQHVNGIKKKVNNNSKNDQSNDGNGRVGGSTWPSRIMIKWIRIDTSAY